MHIGHMEVARTIIDRGLADAVRLMPCRRNPLKEEMQPLDRRLEMLREAVDYFRVMGYDTLSVGLEEMEMPSPSYTCDTLRMLAEKEPATKFRLVVGADSYQQFQNWKNWEWIEKNFSPVVYPRPGVSLSFLRDGWQLLEGVKEIDISSTQIREMMEKGESVRRFMPWGGANIKL